MTNQNDQYTTIQFFAGMTKNGNSRRVYATFLSGYLVATYKDNGQGRESITDINHRKAYGMEIFDTTPAEYKRLVNWKGNKLQI